MADGSDRREHRRYADGRLLSGAWRGFLRHEGIAVLHCVELVVPRDGELRGHGFDAFGKFRLTGRVRDDGVSVDLTKSYEPEPFEFQSPLTFEMTGRVEGDCAIYGRVTTVNNCEPQTPDNSFSLVYCELFCDESDMRFLVQPKSIVVDSATHARGEVLLSYDTLCNTSHLSTPTHQSTVTGLQSYCANFDTKLTKECVKAQFAGLSVAPTLAEDRTMALHWTFEFTSPVILDRLSLTLPSTLSNRGRIKWALCLSNGCVMEVTPTMINTLDACDEEHLSTIDKLSITKTISILVNIWCDTGCMGEDHSAMECGLNCGAVHCHKKCIMLFPVLFHEHSSSKDFTIHLKYRLAEQGSSFENII